MKNVLSISLLALALAFTYPNATTAVEAGQDQNPIVGDLDAETDLTQEEQLVILTVECVKEGKSDGLEGDELVLFIAECVGLSRPVTENDFWQEYRAPPGGNGILLDEEPLEELDEEPDETQIICLYRHEVSSS